MRQKLSGISTYGVNDLDSEVTSPPTVWSKPPLPFYLHEQSHLKRGSLHTTSATVSLFRLPGSMLTSVLTSLSRRISSLLVSMTKRSIRDPRMALNESVRLRITPQQQQHSHLFTHLVQQYI